MSMSTHIIGFRPIDEKWAEMKSVYDVCKNAGVPVPEEVLAFFEYIIPDPSGVIVELDEVAEEWSDDDSAGFEIEISKLPKDIKIVRFFNSW